MPVYPLKLPSTYRDQGFFNVTVEFDGYVRPDEGPVQLVLMADGAEQLVEARANRKAQNNGTARVMGGAELRRWFQDHYRVGDRVDVDICSPELIRIVAPASARAVDPPVYVPINSADLSVAEGREVLRLHRRRERRLILVARKKRATIAEFGRLVCEVCAFDFAATYGPRGEGFAECHHTLPISQSLPGRRTGLSELAIVCANCHRMLHRRPWLSVAELREIVRSREGV